MRPPAGAPGNSSLCPPLAAIGSLGCCRGLAILRDLGLVCLEIRHSHFNSNCCQALLAGRTLGVSLSLGFPRTEVTDPLALRLMSLPLLDLSSQERWREKGIRAESLSEDALGPPLPGPAGSEAFL